MTVPMMTMSEAFLYLDFCDFRIFGWEITERSLQHPRSKAAKAITERWKEILRHAPPVDDFVKSAMEGRPVHELWPEHLRKEVEFSINTKVPRTTNEPTSAEFIADMHACRRTDWMLPEFLKSHGRTA